jgi:hypothetical protein
MRSTAYEAGRSKKLHSGVISYVPSILHACLGFLTAWLSQDSRISFLLWQLTFHEGAS